MKTLFKIIFMLALTTPAYAYRTFTLSGDNRDFKCGYRKTLTESMINKKNFLPSILNLNLSPECLTKEQRQFIQRTEQPVRGIMYGVDGSASKGLEIEGGMELVITAYDRHTLMVGLVKYKGGGASVGLPIGASITTGILHGNCNTIDKYLGHFQNFSVIGINKSFGTENEITNFELTRCNSSSNTVGLSMSLLGYSMTSYEAASQFILLKGARAEELIEFIDRYHPIN